ncbi:MAG: hypothetical protein EZS28_026183, partial [Streblomastix strix]
MAQMMIPRSLIQGGKALSPSCLSLAVRRIMDEAKIMRCCASREEIIEYVGWKEGSLMFDKHYDLEKGHMHPSRLLSKLPTLSVTSLSDDCGKLAASQHHSKIKNDETDVPPTPHPPPNEEYDLSLRLISIAINKYHLSLCLSLLALYLTVMLACSELSIAKIVDLPITDDDIYDVDSHDTCEITTKKTEKGWIPQYAKYLSDKAEYDKLKSENHEAQIKKPKQPSLTKVMLFNLGTNINEIGIKICYEQRRISRTCSQLRSGLAGLIYKKTLLLNIAAQSDINAGRLFSLIAADTHQLSMMFPMFFQLILLPIQIFVPFGFIAYDWGWSSLMSFVILIIASLFQILIIPMHINSSKRYLYHNDTRNKLINETLQGMKVVKLSGLEHIFQSRIETTREVQLNDIFYHTLSIQILQAILRSTPQVMNISAMSVYIATHNVPQLMFPVLVMPTMGSLTMVIGAVGSGKSSIASALIGDIEKQSGTICIDGSIAYCPQTAWINNNTVRGNITFGSKYKKKKYNEVIHVCALEPDFQTLAAGDMTAIGEKGVNLSGGQKSRIQLARAVYSDRDIYILDDPLSAVDAHVGRTLFEQCIDGRLKGKTRLLITNQLQYLDRADNII